MKILCQFLLLSSLIFAQLPDLTVKPGGFSPDSVAHGGLLTISATVQNAGGSTSAASHLSFYLSATTAITDGTLIGCVSVEPLAAGAVSEVKQITVPIPTSLTSGAYYAGWLVDPYNEVNESNENNVFYNPGLQLTIRNSTEFSRHIPYPIIFIHGYNSSDQTWGTLLSQLDKFGWSFGGRLDYCLNYDSNLTTALPEKDIHDFTVQSNLNKGDYYTVNFDVNPDGTVYGNTVESSQSALAKQGKALQSIIKHVLDKTGADKVILAGHSMGGLTSREYLQNPLDWQADRKHHVAKLLTIGTPNGGSDQSTFGGLFGDESSEAVRDMRIHYANSDSGVYLFGGNENKLNGLSYHNNDINCNGIIGDSIIGLNQKSIPADVKYSCIIGTFLFNTDGVVDESSANLNKFYPLNADTFMVNTFHTLLPKQIFTILQGLDEPANFSLAYKISFDTLYYGLTTVQSSSGYSIKDTDEYFFNLKSAGSLNIHIGNIAIPNLSIALYDSSFNRRFIKSSDNLSMIDTTAIFTAGKYYLEVAAQPAAYSWMFPYSFKIHTESVDAVEKNGLQMPVKYALMQNYPNPFNPSTNISFTLSSNSRVSLKIFDVLGREAANLISSEMPAGEHSIIWDASKFTSGIYFCRLQSGSFSQTKKLILLK